MKKYLLLSIAGMLIAGALFAQETDKRAVLQVYGAVDRISVLPDESIWLGTRTGEAYYTKAFEQTWHYANVLEKPADGFTYDEIHKVIGFTKDTEAFPENEALPFLGRV